MTTLIYQRQLIDITPKFIKDAKLWIDWACHLDPVEVARMSDNQVLAALGKWYRGGTKKGGGLIKALTEEGLVYPVAEAIWLSRPKVTPTTD